MPGTISPTPRVSNPDMHHGTCVTHVPWCMPGSLTCGFLWSRLRGKRSRHSRRMRNPQFYVSGKRPIWPAWGPPGSCRPQMGPMLAPWTLLWGQLFMFCIPGCVNKHTNTDCSRWAAKGFCEDGHKRQSQMLATCAKSLLWMFTHLPWTNWPPFPRRYFRAHFCEWKRLHFD